MSAPSSILGFFRVCTLLILRIVIIVNVANPDRDLHNLPDLTFPWELATDKGRVLRSGAEVGAPATLWPNAVTSAVAYGTCEDCLFEEKIQRDLTTAAVSCFLLGEAPL